MKHLLELTNATQVAFDDVWDLDKPVEFLYENEIDGQSDCIEIVLDTAKAWTSKQS